MRSANPAISAIELAAWKSKPSWYIVANEYFRQAIEKDPGYGLAWAGLAESYALFTFYGVQPAVESCPEAKASASKALEIDQTLAELHAILGWIKMSCDWDWRGSESEYKRALEMNPDDAITRTWYSAYLKAMGSVEESIAQYKRPLEADPVNLINNATLGRDLYFAGHDEQAVEQLRKTIDMDPSFVEAHLYLGWVYARRAMFPPLQGPEPYFAPCVHCLVLPRIAFRKATGAVA